MVKGDNIAQRYGDTHRNPGRDRTQSQSSVVFEEGLRATGMDIRDRNVDEPRD